MKAFGGFPEKFEFSALPKPFLAQLLPAIDDLAELKATLGFFRLLYQKKGFPLYVTAAEVFESGIGLDAPAVEMALLKAAARGTFIKVSMTSGNEETAVYLLNDERNREAARRLVSGDLIIEGLEVSGPAAAPPPAELPDIFSLYEQNIGLLTPIIAEELKDALKNYPESWIKDAIKEASSLNKHNWRYITKILDNWAAGGRNDGTYQRDTKEDRDKYVKGKYGKFVQR